MWWHVIVYNDLFNFVICVGFRMCSNIFYSCMLGIYVRSRKKQVERKSSNLLVHSPNVHDGGHLVANKGWNQIRSRSHGTGRSPDHESPPAASQSLLWKKAGVRSWNQVSNPSILLPYLREPQALLVCSYFDQWRSTNCVSLLNFETFSVFFLAS